MLVDTTRPALPPEPAISSGTALRICIAEPNQPLSWLLLGQAFCREGNEASADEAFAEAAGLAPDPFTAALHRVEAELMAGDAEAALARLTNATALDPTNAADWTARGLLLQQSGRQSEAIDALEIAVVLAPEAKRPVLALAELLARSDRLLEAEPMLRRAIALDPENNAIKNDLGTVLIRLYRPWQACEILRALVDRPDPDPLPLFNLTGATIALGLQSEAIDVARRAVALFPERMEAWRSLCNVLPYSETVSAASLLCELRTCSLTLPRGPAPTFTNAPYPDRRIRVGLLSGSLREHPVGWLTVAGLERLDREAFEIVAFSVAESADPIQRRFRALASEWYDARAIPDAALAEHGRTLGIDVLIDLGGYGDYARMTACAWRLAPVQIKWVGMQYHSSGVAEMDWFITDAWETPPHLAHLYSERLLVLPDGYVCYSPPSNAPDVGPLPALARGHVTFGCFNNLAKITPSTIATWSRVLHRVPDARLVLKTQAFAADEVCTRIGAAFEAHGIDPARIEMRGASAHRAFLGQYNDIDIVLDPFPYSGGLTTCEALWMGVPTITLPGEIFASRHSASHLSNVGLQDWLAEHLDAYVDLAVARASDLPALAELRAGLRARVKASPLCDGPRFGRNLGAALRHAWREWCVTASAESA